MMRPEVIFAVWLPFLGTCLGSGFVFLLKGQMNRTLQRALTGFAGIGRDLMVVGCAGQAEIWDAAEYEAYEAENLSPEKLLAALEAIGL